MMIKWSSQLIFCENTSHPFHLHWIYFVLNPMIYQEISTIANVKYITFRSQLHLSRIDALLQEEMDTTTMWVFRCCMNAFWVDDEKTLDPISDSDERFLKLFTHWTLLSILRVSHDVVPCSQWYLIHQDYWGFILVGQILQRMILEVEGERKLDLILCCTLMIQSSVLLEHLSWFQLGLPEFSKLTFILTILSVF